MASAQAAQLTIDMSNMLVPMASFLIFIMGTVWGVVWIIIRWLGNRLVQKNDEWIGRIEKDVTESDRKRDALERSVMDLKAKLPEEYLRREDHIRFSSIIDAKLDTQNAELRQINMNLGQLFARKSGGKNGAES